MSWLTIAMFALMTVMFILVQIQMNRQRRAISLAISVLADMHDTHTAVAKALIIVRDRLNK